jgi:hypothetical protein
MPQSTLVTIIAIMESQHFAVRRDDPRWVLSFQAGEKALFILTLPGYKFDRVVFASASQCVTDEKPRWVKLNPAASIFSSVALLHAWHL